MIADGCGSSGGSEVLRFRSGGAAGVPVHDGAGVTPHRWLKATFAKLNLVKATFSHYRTAPEGTRATPVTGALPTLAVPTGEPHPSLIGGVPAHMGLSAPNWRSGFPIPSLSARSRRSRRPAGTGSPSRPPG